MSFTSLNFLLFFPIMAAAFYVTPARFRWITLLVASYFFYINIKPVFALLMAGITLSTFLFTSLISTTENETRKRNYMRLNIVIILLPLVFYKYFGSINDAMFSIMDSLHLHWPLPEIRLILPIGISFYTFMAIGYTVDVFNEEVEAEKNPGILALFISFFPLVLSGPIERARNMLPQFKAPGNFNYNMVVGGLKLMLWGYFMKLVLADRVGIYVDAVFNNIDQHSGTTLLLAALMYPIQLYGDLGGYSLIAIGCARVMGIIVIPNFNRPFFATSFSEFWRRWHMSLISWLTDYVYTPLSFGLRKYKLWGIVIALNITFFISGLWHGSTLPFVAWGVLNGILLSVETFTNKYKKAFVAKHNLASRWWYILFSCLVTFLLFTSTLLIGGAADSISQGMHVIGKIFTDPPQLPYKDGVTMLYSFIAFLILFTKEFFEEFYPNRFHLFENKNMAIRWLSYYSVIFILIYFGVFGGGRFIYYQF
jgi:alginate O-acetyltransferase complex protein AlgI